MIIETRRPESPMPCISIHPEDWEFALRLYPGDFDLYVSFWRQGGSYIEYTVAADDVSPAALVMGY